MEEVVEVEEVKKPKVDGDVPMDLIQEIVATISDPEEMVGPEVSSYIYCLVSIASSGSGCSLYLRLLRTILVIIDRLLTGWSYKFWRNSSKPTYNT